MRVFVMLLLVSAMLLAVAISAQAESTMSNLERCAIKSPLSSESAPNLSLVLSSISQDRSKVKQLEKWVKVVVVTRTGDDGKEYEIEIYIEVDGEGDNEKTVRRENPQPLGMPAEVLELPVPHPPIVDAESDAHQENDAPDTQAEQEMAVR